MEMGQKRRKNRGKKRPFPYEQTVKPELKKHFTNYHQLPVDGSFPGNSQYLPYGDANIPGNGTQCYGGIYNNVYMEQFKDPRSGYFFNTSCPPQINNGYPYANYGYYFQNRLNYHSFSSPLNIPSFPNGTYDLSRDSLYVTNIPLNCTEIKLYNIFNFENLIARNTINGGPRIKIYKNEQMGASCLITFISSSAASYVKESLDKQEFPGTCKKMKIKFAVHKKKPDISPIGNNNNDNIIITSPNNIRPPLLPTTHEDRSPSGKNGNEEKSNVVGGYIARFETSNDEDKRINEEKKDNKENSLEKRNISIPGPLEDWCCEACKTLNFSYRIKCYQCGKKKQINMDNH